MENNYEKNLEIEYTNVDRNAKLSIVQATNLVQNNVTQFFGKLGSDNLVLKEENNAAWVVSKLKIHFYKYPMWKEKVKLISYISEQSKIRVNIETKAQNENNELLFVSKQESCPIDLTTRKIRKIETINYPSDLSLVDSVFEGSYQKLNIEFKEAENISKREIYAIDTDYTHHTNNTKYIKFMLNTFNSKFLDNNIITDLEVHYINESVEGQILEIYKRDENNEVNFLIKSEEKEIIRANMKYINSI